MNHLNSYPYKEDPRIATLKKDNNYLEKALKELNQCYQQKISILQQQLKKSKSKEAELLQSKSQYITKSLGQNQKYEKQLQKLIKMMEDMAEKFVSEKQNYEKVLSQKDEQINHLANQNNELRQQRDIQEEKIENLAKKYIDQIERLNHELRDLKDQVDYEEVINSNNYSIEDSQEVQEFEINQLKIQLNRQQTDEQTLMNVLKDISNQNICIKTQQFGNEKQKEDQQSHLLQNNIIF